MTLVTATAGPVARGAVDVPALAVATFDGIALVQLRPSVGGAWVWSGVLHATMLVLHVDEQGRVGAIVAAACPVCGAVRPHPAGRLPVVMSPSTTTYLPAPVLRSSADFVRVYGQRPIHPEFGPLGEAPGGCWDCAG